MTAYVVAALARLKARTALKRDFSTALFISFISDLPFLLAQVFGILAVSPVLKDAMEIINSGDETSMAQLQAWNMDDFLMRADHTWGVVSLILMLVSLLTAFLRLGAVNSQLKLLRGESISYGDVLSRAEASFRAIGLMIWRGLWMILWMLPGVAVTVGGFYLVASVITVETTVITVLNLVSVALFLGISVMIFLGGWAFIRYFFATCVMADHPETGPVQALRESRAMVKGNVRRVLMMLLSFIFWYMAANLLSSFLSGVVGQVISLVISALLSLYISTCTASLYETLNHPEQTVPKTLYDEENTVV